MADGPSPALAGNLASVRSMLDVLGLDPLGDVWRSSGPVSDLRGVVDDLVRVALEERAAARERKDYAAADRVRDGLASSGVVVEDTPAGPRWTLGKPAEGER
jgi:cysteinyl-tRNA synthetase